MNYAQHEAQNNKQANRLDPFTKLKHPLMLRFQQKNEPGDIGYFFSAVAPVSTALKL